MGEALLVIATFWTLSLVLVVTRDEFAKEVSIVASILTILFAMRALGVMP